MDLHNEVTWEHGDEAVTFEHDDLPLVRFIEIEAIMSAPPAEGQKLIKGHRITKEQQQFMVDLCVDLVTGWSGVDYGGKPFPCTPENRRRFFGAMKRAEAVYCIVAAVMTQAVPDEKKSDSGNGSGADSSDPRSLAEKDLIGLQASPTAAQPSPE